MAKERKNIREDIADIFLAGEMARIQLGKPPRARWEILGSVYGYEILDRKLPSRKTPDVPLDPVDKYGAIAALFEIELIREKRKVIVSGIENE